ncbi:hypothetical protein HDV01_003739 [Terramyces sp. JEL0728]|nr:hypothetical protein HDV01_003739 [Terramyces sp. JEL0728]
MEITPGAVNKGGPMKKLNLPSSRNGDTVFSPTSATTVNAESPDTITSKYAGGCPAKKLGIASQIEEEDATPVNADAKSPQRQSIVGEGSTDQYEANSSTEKITAEQDYRNHTAEETKNLFDHLREETDEIEKNIGKGERDVLLKDEIAFLTRRHDLALSNLAQAQVADFQKQKESLAAVLVARAERKKAKKEARKSIRASKRRDQVIQQQKNAAQAAARIREAINEKRLAFDALSSHMNEIHDKQRKNLIHGQERRFSSEKTLCVLETRHLKVNLGKHQEELRSTILKKFHVRQNHQGHLNKRINDNLREFQLLELRHSKEKFELEIVSFEEVGNRRIVHETQMAELRLKHMNEMHTEKENVVAKKEASKEAYLLALHQKELRELAHEQKIAIRQLRIKQDEKIHSKRGFSSKGASTYGSKGGSKVGSNAHSRSASITSNNSGIEMEGKKSFQLGADKLKEDMDENDEFDNAVLDKTRMSQSLLSLAAKHKDEMAALEELMKQETNDCTLAFEAKMTEMEEAHEAAIVRLLEDQERDINNLRAVQEKEIKMEESMHDSEMKMLVERRVLNSVLESVADGIINITPDGCITRFNHAAERMFGYSDNEVIGLNISRLMPTRYAENHSQYLDNYLSTGVKKVIGTGRRIYGLKKDSTEFPIHLSISELKDNGEHLFTGIARDLTEEVAEEERIKALDLEKKRELENMVAKLDVTKKKADGLISQMLPQSVSAQLLNGQKVKPQSFESATIFFLDVVGFTSITSKIEPLDTVVLLNSLYSVIDAVIEKYDVYKVETVGDTYLVVSGLPLVNKYHAEEIATMSLHLMYAIERYVFPNNPELRIRVRIGLNSGPVVAGVIGSKMPRYCVFGDTVNTGSRMESNGQPSKIHLSASTHKLLSRSGEYVMSNRGEIEVKAVSVSLPTWKDNVGYEEGDPRLFQYCLDRFGKDEESLLILNSREATNECRTFMRRRITEQAKIHLVELVATSNVQSVYSFSTPKIYIILFPSKYSKVAKEFWQHTGTGITSRFAEYCLIQLDVFYVLPKQREPVTGGKVQSFKKEEKSQSKSRQNLESSKVAAIFVEERFGRNLDMKLEIEQVKCALKKRIAGVLGDANDSADAIDDGDDNESLRDEKVNQDHVFLFPSGMQAIYFSHKLTIALYPGLKSVQYGFPYTDTLKIQEKFGTGAHFFGHGSTKDLDSLGKLLEKENISGLYCEFPSNPLLESPPLEKLWGLALRHNFILIVDETIGNIVNINILNYCHIVVSSLTKVFSGDSNVMGGSLIVNPLSNLANTLIDKVQELYQDDLWHEDVLFLERNSRHFKYRIGAINNNTERLCDVLVKHPKVKKLYYPKYTCKEQYERFAIGEKKGYGGLFSVVLHSKEQAERFYDLLPIYKGPSLGTNFTLACPYTLLAHYTELDWAEKFGVSPWLIRISIGMEDIDWLVSAFVTALDNI